MTQMLSKIGIMDWGIGGFSVYQALRQIKKSNVDVVYLSDSGFTPYGKLSRQQMRDRFDHIGRFFFEKQINQVLVACNAASSALVEEGEIFNQVYFQSIIPYGVNALSKTKARKIGIIGGELTISSRVYASLIEKMPEFHPYHFTYTTAQPLSAFVEAGILEGSEVESEISSVLSRLGSIESLLLACTHYPALSPIFRKLQAQIELLDPASAMASSVRGQGTGGLAFYSTGSVDLSAVSASRAFALQLETPIKLTQETLTEENRELDL